MHFGFYRNGWLNESGYDEDTWPLLKKALKSTAPLERLLRSGALIMLPEIADYEVRRELLSAGKTTGVRRLDQLKLVLH
jgi:hypothetical protein